MSKENKKLSSVNTEQAVLATLMSNDGSFDIISGKLTTHDFVSSKHQLIFKAIAELANNNSPYEIDAVYDWLGRNELLGNHGVSEQYLIQMIQEMPPSMFNLEFYAGLIRSKSDRRKAIDIHKQAIEMLESADDDTADVTNEAMDKLTSILTGSQEPNYKMLGDLMGELVEEMHKRQTQGNPFIKTGFETLDNKMMMNNGDLVVLAARPSMGKTALAVNMLMGIAKQYEGTAVFFSLEMRDLQVMERIAAAECDIALSDIRGGTASEDDWARYQAFVGSHQDLSLATVEKAQMTVGQIRTELNRISRERRHHHDGKISVIAIDYLQIMGGIDEDKVNKIGMVTRTLKALGKEYDCPVILLSQLSRGVEQRPNKRPISSDLRDSGTIEQDADIVAMIYRDDYYKSKEADDKGHIKQQPDGLAEIILTKNRNGATGSVVMGFEGHYSRFVESMPEVVINDDDYYIPENYSGSN